MKYLKIILNPADRVIRKRIVEAIETTTDHDQIVENGCLFLQLHNETELISEIFCLGLAYADLNREGIDNPFDFEIVPRKTLPPEVAMAMN